MGVTPLDLVREATVPARLTILVPKVDQPEIPLRFNPTEYQLQKSNNLAEVAIPGLQSPPIQYVRGAAEKLSLDLLVDTSDTLEDVREKFVKRLRGLLDNDGELHAPPIVAFTWDRDIFRGVLESMNVTYLLFTPTGRPLRAKLSVTIREYRPIAVEMKTNPKRSPDLDKSYVVRRGDTLSGIAGQIYRDPEQWRAIAERNNIRDPRRIEPGWLLLIPRLR